MWVLNRIMYQDALQLVLCVSNPAAPHSLLLFPQYEEQYWHKTSYFFLRNYNYNYSTVYIHHGCILHTVLFVINTLIPRLCEMLYARHIKFLAAVPELFKHTVFQAVIVCKTVSSKCILQEAKNLEVGGCSIKIVVRMWENSPMHCCLSPLCAVWHSYAGQWLDLSSCLAEPFKFVALTSFMSIHITLNWLWHLTARIPLNKIPFILIGSNKMQQYVGIYLLQNHSLHISGVHHTHHQNIKL